MNSCNTENVNKIVVSTNGVLIYLIPSYSPSIGDVYVGYEYWEKDGEHLGIAHYRLSGDEYRYKHFLAEDVPKKHLPALEKIRKNKMKSLLS